MAVATGTMMAVMAGVSIAGQLAQGRAARKAAEADARMQEMQAAQMQDQAKQEAERIRRAADKTRSTARAQMAANGVRVDQGTALQIDEEIGFESEKDAQMTLLTGQRQGGAARFAAGQSRAAGRNAQNASVLGAISTGVQGWKGVKVDNGYRYKVPSYDGAEY